MKTDGGRESPCKDGDESARSESGSQKIIFSHRAAQAFVDRPPQPGFSKHQKHVSFHIPRPILELNV